MNKTLILSIALLTAPLVFAAPANATWSCGLDPLGLLDSCGGDTNADNPYAGCDGEWRDLMVGQIGTYTQVCAGDSPHIWVCPMSYSYSVNSGACHEITA